MTDSGHSVEATARIDGGSRGNPGPAAYGVVVQTADGKPLQELSKCIGEATNNEAEYRGLLAALEYALSSGITRLKVVSDSELLVRQMQGRYKVKNKGLKVLFQQAQGMIARLDSFKIQHVLREQNREADRLVNEALDAAGGIRSATASVGSETTARRPIRVTATYHGGLLKLQGPLSLVEGEEVQVQIHRKRN
jgi:probable phosphoglycerate mutase